MSATFDDVFIETRRHRLRGGAKSSGAEEIFFDGAPFGRRLQLVSRVRLLNPFESFETSSGHRIRDSKVGDAGYWIDILVVGECSDDELRALRAMAQDVDTRLVVVRRK